MYKRIASRKMKSISLEDLGTIVKQMINRTLEDTEQMSKLHRAIYEELYFQKMTAFEGGTLEESSDKNLPQNIFEIKCIRDTTNNDELEKSPKQESKTNGTQECKDIILSDQWDKRKVQKTVKESGEMSIIRCPKTIEVHIEKPEKRTTWSSSQKSEKSLNENALRNEQAFNIWRREKTKAMRRTLKEEQRKKQEELTAEQEKTERKRATHEFYLGSTKLLEKNRKLEEAQRRSATDDYSKVQDQENARITANEEAFKAWIKRKNNLSIQRRSPIQRCRPQTAKANYCTDIVFDTWLNQLDSVLHQKYLRERRYLVRSFYCQPAYYGTAALCML